MTLLLACKKLRAPNSSDFSKQNILEESSPKQRIWELERAI